MEGNYANNDQQVQDENANSNPISPTQNNTNNSNAEIVQADTNESQDSGSKRPPLSRGSTLESIQEEEDSELEERLLLESFKSITDIFENGYQDEQTSNGKNSPSTAQLTSKSESISEDTDSLDEEVRQIMLKSEEKQRQKQENEMTKPAAKNVNVDAVGKEKKGKEDERVYERKQEEKEEEVGLDDDYSDEEEDESEVESIATDTESMSESEPESEIESLSEDDKKTGSWAPGEHDDSSDDDDFDFEAYLQKLCSQKIDSDSSSESEGPESEDETQKAIKKVMKMYSKKYSQSDEDDSDVEDNVEETDLEDEEIEEIEVKDDDSSVYSSSDDETDSDFLDDDSPSISTSSSVNGDYEIDDHDKETLQAISEELPYLSDQTMPSHEIVYKYYLGARPDSCPEKIEVQDGELGENVGLDNTLASRSVINLRWPFTSYYVKEFDLDSESPTYKDDDILPCYKSMKSSASFPGRRRNVMLGRVWWVEWWARDALKDHEEEEEEEDENDNKAEQKEEGLEEVGESGLFQREQCNTQF